MSTVEVWTAQTPRVEVRSIAEAIQETAERFTCVLLTPEQVKPEDVCPRIKEYNIIISSFVTFTRQLSAMITNE